MRQKYTFMMTCNDSLEFQIDLHLSVKASHMPKLFHNILSASIIMVKNIHSLSLILRMKSKTY